MVTAKCGVEGGGASNEAAAAVGLAPNKKSPLVYKCTLVLIRVVFSPSPCVHYILPTAGLVHYSNDICSLR